MINNPDILLNWLAQKLDCKWVSDAKLSKHPLKTVLSAYTDPARNKDILLSSDFARVLAFANTVYALNIFPTRRRTGQVIEDSRFCDQLLKRAKLSFAEFDATEIEAIVAWSYRISLKLPIIALETKEDPTADFQLQIQNQNILIECKARNILTPIHRQIEDMRSKIISITKVLVNSSPVNYGISISTSKVPEKNTISELIKELEIKIKSKEAFTLTVGYFYIEAIILLAKDEEIITQKPEPFGPFEHVPVPIKNFMIKHGVANSQTYAGVEYQCQMKREENLIYYKNPKVITVHFAITPDHTKAVAELIRDGRKQLDRNIPGIIAIRAPDFYGSNQFTQLGKNISGILNLNKRVSAVLLFHQALETNTINPLRSEHKLWWQIVLVRNTLARHPLPLSFESDCLPREGGFQVFNRT
jgi:hypothetical protein